TVYLYERAAEHEYGVEEPGEVHVMRRGGSDRAGQLVRSIIATQDEPVTAHETAAQVSADLLPDRVRSLLDRRAAAANRRRLAYQEGRTAALRYARHMETTRERHASQEIDYGIER